MTVRESFEKRVPETPSLHRLWKYPLWGSWGAPEVASKAVKDISETLAELRFSARVSVSASQ